MTLPSGVHMSDSAVLNTSPTAIEEPIEEGFKIFPNPTIDVIHVTAKQKGYLEVTDVNGSLLKKIRVNNPDILISLAGYPAGIYFILFHDKTGSYSRKCFKK